MVPCLNIFPYKNGIFSDLSPAGIILGSPDPDYNNLMITFGGYVQFYIGITNRTKQITVGGISLHPENERA